MPFSDKDKDLLEKHAKEVFNKPDNWHVYIFALNEKGTAYHLTGACLQFYIFGEKRGQINWKSLEVASRCTLTFTVESHNKWLNKQKQAICKV